MGKKSREKKERRKPTAAAAQGGPAAPPPVHGRLASERTMADLHRLLSEQNFADIDEANHFLADLITRSGGRVPSRPARTPAEAAQDIMYEAWEARGRQRVTLARKALEVSADCADAYVLLAEETAPSLREACDLFAQGVEAGERALGEAFFRENAGRFWGILETRPYMRARHGLADCLWALDEQEAALAHYQEMLRLNPNDNQGLRDVLLGCLLEVRRDEEAGRLLNQYEDDGSATWLYNWALLVFRQEGDSVEARGRLEEALEGNQHVPAYLLGRRRFPRELPDLVGFGDESEAIAYAADAFVNWRQTPGAREWLEAAL